MKKTITYFVLIGILIISALPYVSAQTTIQTTNHNIAIELVDKGLSVEENLIVNNTTPMNQTIVTFWLQQDASDVKILAVNSGDYLTGIVTSNLRECNLSKYNLTLGPNKSIELRVTYNLPTNTDFFEKTLQYDTTYLSVSFGNRELYQGDKLQASSSFSVQIYTPTEAPLSLTYLIIIFILAVLLIASMMMLFRKKRTQMKKPIEETEEMLRTNKTLLLSILKSL